jgi:hypothetical protein
VEEEMKKLLYAGLCLLFICGGSVFAQDRMVITFTDGSVQVFDTNRIMKIEYQSAQAGTSSMIQPRTVSLQSYNYQTHFIRHANFLGEITTVSSELDKKDSTFRVVQGLADSRYISFESINYPGYFLRHQDYRLKLHKLDGSNLFKEDATFKMAPGLADGSWTSFESFNYPGYYIRHKNYHLFIEKGNDDLFRKDTTFRFVAPTP